MKELLVDDARIDRATDDVCGDGDDDVAKDESPEDDDDVRVSADDDDESAGFCDAITVAAAAKSEVVAESVRPNERW